MQLLLALENSVSLATTTILTPSIAVSGSGRFMQMAGIRIVWNPFLPVGQRVVSASVMNMTTGVYAPLQPMQQYTMTIEDYARGGGDGYTMFMPSPRVPSILTTPSNVQFTLIGNTTNICAAQTCIHPRSMCSSLVLFVLLLVSQFIQSPAFVPSAYALDGRISTSLTQFPPIVKDITPATAPTTGAVTHTRHAHAQAYIVCCNCIDVAMYMCHCVGDADVEWLQSRRSSR